MHRRAVNPQHLQILRVDREGMIDDVTMHGTWRYLCKKHSFIPIILNIIFCSDSKRSKQMLLALQHSLTNHILLLVLTLHTGVCEETFNVNIKTQPTFEMTNLSQFNSSNNIVSIVQTTQNIWNFIVRESSQKEMANFRRLSRRFHTLIWRPGDAVQNLESPGLSGRIDSTALILDWDS